MTCPTTTATWATVQDACTIPTAPGLPWWFIVTVTLAAVIGAALVTFLFVDPD